MTVFILIPWFTVREVKVDIEIVSVFSGAHFMTRPLLIDTRTQPSPKVAILRFERGMQQGLLARISRSSIMEVGNFFHGLNIPCLNLVSSIISTTLSVSSPKALTPSIITSSVVFRATSLVASSTIRLPTSGPVSSNSRVFRTHRHYTNVASVCAPALVWAPLSQHVYSRLIGT